MEEIKLILEENNFSQFEIHFAQSICELCQDNSKELFLTVVLLCHAAFLDKTFIKLSHKEKFIIEFRKKIKLDYKLPNVKKKLLFSNAIGKPGDYKPIIIDNHCLYLQRYWEYKNYLINFFKSQMFKCFEFKKLNLLNELRILFKNDLSFYKEITYFILIKPLSIIFGLYDEKKKVKIITRVLYILNKEFEFKQDKFDLLNYSIITANERSAIHLYKLLKVEFKKFFVKKEFFLEKILSFNNFINHQYDLYFKQKKINILFIDNSSMLNLINLYKIINIIPSNCKLILITDNNQIAFYREEAIIANICLNLNFNNNQKKEKITNLTKNIFFNLVKKTKNIQIKLPNLINSILLGDSKKVFNIIKYNKNIIWCEIPNNVKYFKKKLEKIVIKYHNCIMKINNPEKALFYLNNLQILCLLDKGIYGANNINKIIYKIIYKNNNLNYSTNNKNLYQGCPLIIKNKINKYHLVNGDIGIIWPDDKNQQNLKAFFLNSLSKVKYINLNNLPSYKIAYAINTFDSQSLKFNKIILILPNYNLSKITREYLYTAISSAKKRIEIWGTQNIFKNFLSRKL